MITNVATSNFRGGTFNLPLSPFTVIQGPVGAGKTSILDAIKYAGSLPDPRFGTTNLDKLSPTGEWSIELTVADGRRFRRTTRQGTSGFAVNGVGQTAASYAATMKSLICVEPYHMDARAFMGLSGEKRAAMFAGMLSDKEVSLSQCFKVAGSLATSLGDLATALFGAEDAKRLADLLKAPPPPGTSQSLVEALNSARNECRVRKKSAADAVGAAEQAKKTSGVDPDAMRKQIGILDQQIGERRAEISNVEGTKRTYDAVVTLETQASSRLAGCERLLAALRQSEQALPGLLERLEQEKGKESASGEPISIRTLELAVVTMENLPAPNDEQIRIGWNRGVAAAIEAVDAMAAGERKRLTLPSVGSVKANVANLQKAVSAAQTDVARIADVARERDEADEALLKVRAQLQQTAPPTDATAVRQLLTQDQLQRSSLATDLSNASRHSAIINAGPLAAADVVKFDSAIKVLDEAIVIVQRYRDIITAKSVERITDPMTRRLELLFGRKIPMNFSMEGQGRGAQVEFEFVIKDAPVRLVDLSDGEFVMVSVAFLAALQEIKGTPGSLLLLEIDALTEDLSARFLRVLPQLGVEQIIIATNRACTLTPDWNGILLAQPDVVAAAA